MKIFNIITAFSLLLSAQLLSQNDIDAMRYSQTYFGGTARSKAMAGSFGALGADGSCMGINPAGIGLYKKGDINLSLGLLFNSVDATHNGEVNNSLKANINFNGLTLVGAWDSKTNKDNHHALGLGCNQVVNFSNNTLIEGMSNHKSITQDMLATAKNVSVSNLDGGFAGLGYETYVLDTLNGKYYSFVNTKYDLKQSKSIQTSGRVNDWNINYAYGYKDKLYIGAAIGIEAVNYSYNSVYSESDVNDSMRIKKNGSSYSTTYNYPINIYSDSKTGILLGGFKDLSYQETYKTTGTGYNLKLGVIYRATDFMRLGVSFVTPTVYNLTDTYTYHMKTEFDNTGSYTSQYPPSPGGKFSYKIYTPLKLTGSIAFLYKKMGAVNVDYDFINYSNASLQDASSNSLQTGQATFTGVNATIKSKYSQSSNLRVGGELNIKPLFIRLGYAMYGSPFGDKFSGDFVKTFYTGGVGFRKDKFYVDISFTKSLSSESYYMYNPNYVDRSTLKNSGTTIGITIGSKF